MNIKQIIWTLIFTLMWFYGFSQNWDIDLARKINHSYNGSGYWEFATATAYYISACVPFSLLIGGLLTRDPAVCRKGLEILGAIVLELIMSEILKLAVDRERPAQRYPHDIIAYHVVDGDSFPSGHTSLTFAAAAALSIQYKKWYVSIPAYMWAASVGYSRVYLGVHYPTDVITGSIVGIKSAYLMHWLNHKIKPRWQKRLASS